MASFKSKASEFPSWTKLEERLILRGGAKGSLVTNEEMREIVRVLFTPVTICYRKILITRLEGFLFTFFFSHLNMGFV